MKPHETSDWRPIPGYERYLVSSDGRVRSVRFPGRELAYSTRGGIYLLVCLYGPAGKQNVSVHAVVAAAFHGPKPDWATVVRHLNDNPRDNRAENLAYGTQHDNGLDAVRNKVNRNAQKTHCPNGHPYDAENTVWRGRRRHCQACIQLRSASRHTGPRAKPAPKHGTAYRYAAYKCRCDDCRDAKRKQNRREYEKRRLA